MRFLDLFSGIGGFRLGLEMAGHECVGHVEIDKYANQSYRAIHKPKEREFFHEDITTITDESIRELRDRGIDIIAGGFPCQAFSIAGKRAGFEDTRGTLFFNIARIAKEIKPKYLFLENVKGLLNHDRGDTFEVILRSLDEIGYDAEWQVLNSKHFGVPQNRERVFIIGHLRGGSTRKVFPIGSEYEEADGLQGQHIGTITTRTGNSGTVGTYIVEGERVSQEIEKKHNRKVAIPVLTPDRAEKRQNGRRFKEDGDPMFTLTAQDRHGVMIKEATKQKDNLLLDQRYIDGMSDEHSFAKKKAQEMLNEKGELPERFNPYNSQEVEEVSPTLTANCDRSTNSSTVLMKQPNFRIRKLTPKECWRLQGFPDWAFERAKAVGVSDSQLYKQAGNSVTVTVVYEIAKRLK